jgi:hypothetical protein
MDGSQKARALKMVDQLKTAGTNCGLLSVQGDVVMRCPGEPYTDTPTNFNDDDLKNAVALGLLRKQKVGGSFEWEYYVVKE